MSNKLDQLRQMTDVVADTGEIDAIRKFKPMDATTNPSLLFKAASLPGYDEMLDAASQWARKRAESEQEFLADSCDHFAVAVGKEILKIVPGRISTEVDARLSFRKRETIECAK